jgi:hypothetical protein
MKILDHIDRDDGFVIQIKNFDNQGSTRFVREVLVTEDHAVPIQFTVHQNDTPKFFAQGEEYLMPIIAANVDTLLPWAEVHVLAAIRVSVTSLDIIEEEDADVAPVAG